MKPAPFAYHDPETIEEALALLSEHGDDAKVLAGGQSLIPLLNFRLARPEVLVDVNRIAELRFLIPDDGGVRIGATVRQSQIEHAQEIGVAAPLLLEAVQYVAHPQIRNRGTVGGSVAHADPAAELPAAMLALDATMVVSSAEGTRRLPARDFFVSHLTTALHETELLTEVALPPLPARTGNAFTEFTRRHGDYALGGAAVTITLDEVGMCTRARVVLLAGGDVPIRADAAEALLIGASVTDAVAASAAEAAVRDIQPLSNAHGSGEYRRRVIRAMCAKALVLASGRAREVAV